MHRRNSEGFFFSYTSSMICQQNLSVVPSKCTYTLILSHISNVATLVQASSCSYPSQLACQSPYDTQPVWSCSITLPISPVLPLFFLLLLTPLSTSELVRHDFAFPSISMSTSELVGLCICFPLYIWQKYRVCQVFIWLVLLLLVFAKIAFSLKMII